ncbi:ATP-binding protein [Micromonospora olivasterospora]|uniref:histidine kinase n=1 Tax=Micromonospora olivasterospora TaxID=1880 RepID=A0A562IAT4_MICOL|nr:sensor histidine kinase [Micromonospora olivasterospora]TWH67803.1 signal transduction histidine kinase [Micromonospora olivasterospora]
MTTPVPVDPLLLRMTLRIEHDIFLVRQRGREVAAAVGLEHQDQVRLATALSEVARDLLGVAGGADVTFVAVLHQPGPPSLRVDLAPLRPLPDGRYEPRSGAVARLVDMLGVVDRRGDTVVRMSRRVPPSASALTPERLAELRAQLGRTAPGSALDELALQNQQLVAALDEVRSQRDELAVLNEELQETNRGVLALYNQLTEELEETNRGVVALYAELDEKSAQLRSASEAKSRFLANVSHELRAPVTAIIGLTRLLADSASDPLTAEQTRQVGLVRSSATDLLSLVNELLDLTKAESGRLEPDWAEVDLRAVFGQLRGTLRALAKPGVELVVEEPPAPGTLRSDEVLLAQVLRNLLHNGLKFTERGEVRLRAEVREGWWRLSVSDTGIGIDPEQHERIFEEFYQVPGSSRPGGTGLGLPYARRVVRLLGGTLELDSEPGRGSTFRAILPTGGA